MIEVQELTKIFRKPVRGKGLIGMITTLFSRKYTEIRAVDGVSFDIPEGEIVGYIGSNGAGKSTTIKMMCGILTPTSGKVLIDGKEPYLKRRIVAKDIGVVFGQKTQLWWDIPLVESFKVLKEVYQVSDSDYEERIKNLHDAFKITRSVKNERFLIVDDVCTTASTINEIAETLKKNGAASVNGLTLARRTPYFV